MNLTEPSPAAIGRIGTYAPPWKQGELRVVGPDEDALTMAVAAGRAADPDSTANRVVFVSRDFPLLEGGNGAVLLAGLSLPDDVPVAEVLGGAPAVLDQLLAARPGTLVVAADVDARCGAAAALVAAEGARLTDYGRTVRSLPVAVRARDGVRHSYGDPRLEREVGVKPAIAALGVEETVCLAVGLTAKDLGALPTDVDVVIDSRGGASSLIHALADVVERGASGVVVAAEQASASGARLTPGPCVVHRDEAPPQQLAASRRSEGTGIPISLAAYSRAFQPKLRWEGAVFEERPGIDATPIFPPRVRVDANGVLASSYELVPLPRTGTVYTHTTVRIPVPDLPSPYSLAIVQLDAAPVRVLLKVTGVPAGAAQVGQHGTVVMRKIADRAGIPDYGYAFWPARDETEVEA